MGLLGIFLGLLVLIGLMVWMTRTLTRLENLRDSRDTSPRAAGSR